MKRTGQVLPSRRIKIQNLKAAHEQGQPALWNKQGGKKDLLLRHPNFVAKSPNARREPSPLACETGIPHVKMNQTGCTGKRGTTSGARREINSELGLQVYLAHLLVAWLRGQSCQNT
jgi:hypothetical protein